MNLIRADLLLTHQGKASSRSQAADLIRRGLVTCNGKPVLKPGTLVPRAVMLMVAQAGGYVSRGGDKLVAALEKFHIDVMDLVVLDCGASSGGFSDCLLQRGACRVYAVDVGYGQLDWKIRNDPRVIVLERTNIRVLPDDAIPEKLDLATLDVSFISLKLVLPTAFRLLKPDGCVVALVKPQFEIGKELIGSGGIVRNPEHHRNVLNALAEFIHFCGWSVCDMVISPLKGPKGNREFFFKIAQTERMNPGLLKQKVEDLVSGQMDR